MKTLLIDIFNRDSPVPTSEIDQISPKLAKAYAKMHPRTPMRDIETLEEKGFLIREGRTVRANKDLIASFLPLKAVVD